VKGGRYGDVTFNVDYLSRLVGGFNHARVYVVFNADSDSSIIFNTLVNLMDYYDSLDSTLRIEV